MSTEIQCISIWERFSPTVSKCKISQSKLVDFINLLGYGKFYNDLVIRTDDNIITVSDFSELTKFVYDYFLEMPEEEFFNEDTFGVVKQIVIPKDDDGNELPQKTEYFTKTEVKKALIEYGVIPKGLLHYLNYYSDSEKTLSGVHPELYTPIFRDSKDEVYTFFENGIVRTTKNGSKTETYGMIKDGFIWDSQRDLKVKNIQLISKEEKGLFEEFIEKAMSVKDKKGNWKIDSKEYEAFRTVYGYMISNYTNHGETPIPLFVDRCTDGVHAEGGNGKSLVMNSIKYWKKTTPINGRNVSKDNRFQFSGVDRDTQFIHMDDVNSNFPFEIIYNYATGDMEIEKKGVDRFVISMEDKPKIGVCTNYIMSDTSHSTSRRQYIIEFGEYWNLQNKKGISVEKELGKRLFEQFDDNDWIQFYNYGFRCVSEFLKKGVIQTDKSNYKKKQEISQIEGDGVNDGVYEWIEVFITKHKSTFKDKMDSEKFFLNFMNHFDEDVTEKWNQTRFKQSVFQICLNNKWGFNPHKPGLKLSQKRWKVGPAGKQKEHFRIIV